MVTEVGVLLTQVGGTFLSFYHNNIYIAFNCSLKYIKSIFAPNLTFQYNFIVILISMTNE